MMAVLEIGGDEMDSVILAGIIGGFIGGTFSIIAALILLLPFIKQWKDEMREIGHQQERDVEYSMRVGNIMAFPGSETKKLKQKLIFEEVKGGKVKIEKRSWWEFWK